MSNNKGIIRLFKYNKALLRLKQLGFVKIFSDNLADVIGVNTAQVRKDFSLFGITGNKKGGYLIDGLLERLKDILGQNIPREVVIIGLGNLGQALLKHKGFDKENLRLIAGFDIDAAKLDRDSAIPQLTMDELPTFLTTRNVELAILAVPENAAQSVYEQLMDLGILGILNFSPIRIRTEKQSTVRNVNLELELEILSFMVHNSHNEDINMEDSEE